MVLPENSFRKEFVEEELQILVRFIERHVEWAKLSSTEDLVRLNTVSAELLAEAANMLRLLHERLDLD